jgi:hypothetical protein
MSNLLSYIALGISIAFILAVAILRYESARLDHDPFGDDENEHGRWDS